MFDIIGIDWGTKYFGVAFANSSTKLIIPSTKFYTAETFLEDLKTEIEERKIYTIVLGRPSNFFLKNTENSHKVDEFSQNLKIIFPNIKIETVNERGSSRNYSNFSDKKMIHNLSAVTILEWYLKI